MGLIQNTNIIENRFTYMCVSVCKRDLSLSTKETKKWMLPSILRLNSKKCGQRILWFALYRFPNRITFSPTMSGTLRQAGITWIYRWRHQITWVLVTEISIRSPLLKKISDTQSSSIWGDQGVLFGTPKSIMSLRQDRLCFWVINRSDPWMLLVD